MNGYKKEYSQVISQVINQFILKFQLNKYAQTNRNSNLLL